LTRAIPGRKAGRVETWTEAGLARLEEALRTYDPRAVAASVDRFVEVARFRGGGPALLGQALRMLDRLHTERHVRLVLRLCEGLLRNGVDDPRVRHRYALALLDTDLVAAAEAVLRRLPASVIQTDADVRGAIGRVHQIRYLTGRAGPDLGEAVTWYRSTYDLDPGEHAGHGINAAAMLLRAERDGVVVPGYATPGAEASALAAAILGRIGEPGPRQTAIAAEACLILGRHDEALEWVVRYLHSDAGAVDFETTLRQFEQVHGLAEDVDPGRRVLPLLRSEDGRRRGEPAAT
jgi:hypothetical protein